MAITDKKLPETVSLVRSPVQVSFQSNLPAALAAIDYSRNRILGSPLVNETFQVVFGEVNETFTVQTLADSSGNTLSVQGALTVEQYAQQLVVEFNRNTVIYLAFDVEFVDSAGSYFVWLRPRKKTTDTLTVTSMLTNVDSDIVSYAAGVENPSLLLMVETYDHTLADYLPPISHVLPLLSPSESVVFDIQKDFVLRHALPDAASIGLGGDYITACTDNWTKYRIRWTEQQGRPSVAGGLDDNSQEEYFAVYGGNAFLLRYDDFWSFWSVNGRFFTAQKTTKTITMEQPEWLYWIGRDLVSPTVHLHVVATHRDTTTSTYQRGGISVKRGNVICMKAGFTQLSLPEDNANPIVSYTLVLRKADNSAVSEIFTYFLTGTYGEFNRYFLFGNSLGGCDTVRATGKFTTSLDITTQQASRVVDANVLSDGRGRDFDYDREVRGMYEGSIGYKTAEQIAYLQDLLQSPEVWMIDIEKTRFSPVQVDAGSIQLLKDGDDLYSLRFSYRHAWQDNSLGLSDDGQRFIVIDQLPIDDVE